MGILNNLDDILNEVLNDKIDPEGYLLNTEKELSVINLSSIFKNTIYNFSCVDIEKVEVINHKYLNTVKDRQPEISNGYFRVLKLDNAYYLDNYYYENNDHNFSNFLKEIIVKNKTGIFTLKCDNEFFKVFACKKNELYFIFVSNISINQSHKTFEHNFPSCKKYMERNNFMVIATLPPNLIEQRVCSYNGCINEFSNEQGYKEYIKFSNMAINMNTLNRFLKNNIFENHFDKEIEYMLNQKLIIKDSFAYIHPNTGETIFKIDKQYKGKQLKEIKNELYEDLMGLCYNMYNEVFDINTGKLNYKLMFEKIYEENDLFIIKDKQKNNTRFVIKEDKWRIVNEITTNKKYLDVLNRFAMFNKFNKQIN